MKILQLSYRVPYPPTDGGTIGIYNITKGYADEGAEVHLLAINTPKHHQPAGCLAGIATQYDVFVDTRITLLKALRNLLFTDIPYIAERFIHHEVEERLRSLLQEQQFDAIHVEGTFVNYYIPTIRQYSKAPIITRAHNIEYVIWERLAQHTINPLKKWYVGMLAKRLKRFEARYFDLADTIAAITPEDCQRLRDIGVKAPIEVIPAGVMPDKFPVSTAAEALPNSVFILSALDWLPNQEGLKWFMDEVWANLQQKNPGISLHIAGKNTPPFVQAWHNGTSVYVHGFVPDAAVFMQSYQLMLVPLLSGGGMRVKIIEGMAAGKCIVSSLVGAEGIAYTEGENIRIARDPKTWVEQITGLLQNQQEIARIGSNARKLIDEQYDNRSVSKKYLKLLNQLMA